MPLKQDIKLILAFCWRSCSVVRTIKATSLSTSKFGSLPVDARCMIECLACSRRLCRARQHGHSGSKKAVTRPNPIYEVLATTGKLYFFRLAGSQKEHDRPTTQPNGVSLSRRLPTRAVRIPNSHLRSLSNKHANILAGARLRIRM